VYRDRGSTERENKKDNKNKMLVENKKQGPRSKYRRHTNNERMKRQF
jgi:hypothetical protein